MKVTLSLPTELLHAVDRFVEAHPRITRSGVCASALRAWVQAQQDDEIADYYTGLSGPEKADDASWRRIASERAASIWP